MTCKMLRIPINMSDSAEFCALMTRRCLLSYLKDDKETQLDPSARNLVGAQLRSRKPSVGGTGIHD